MQNTHKSPYPIALQLAKNIGPSLYKKLIDHFGDAENVFRASPTQLSKFFPSNETPQQLSSQESKLLDMAEILRAQHQARNIDIIAYGEATYPLRLAQIYAPPPLLFCTARVQLHKKRMISIVGTRHPSNYGKAVAKELVAQLQKYNPIIVSGLAYGIDIEAHKSALEHNLPTIAVMAGGLDTVYPTAHTHTAQEAIRKGGGLVSEQSLGIKPSNHHFPARNRIIAGLCDATIVVEAPKKSGALITAYYANEFNREVFAIPSTIHTNSSIGCHTLIKNHLAHLITHADDLATMMEWSYPNHHKASPHPTVKQRHLTKQEEALVTSLAKATLHTTTTESLSKSLHMPVESALALALQLQMKGMVDIAGNQCQLKSA